MASHPDSMQLPAGCTCQVRLEAREVVLNPRCPLHAQKLTAIPKPEGLDLRDRRSSKTSRGSDWQPQDAVYDAWQTIGKKDVDAVMVIYREVNPDGSTVTRFTQAGPVDATPALLMNAMGRFMGWQS